MDVKERRLPLRRSMGHRKVLVLSLLDFQGIPKFRTLKFKVPKMVGQGRLELPTSRLSVVRSNQLSYKPR